MFTWIKDNSLLISIGVVILLFGFGIFGTCSTAAGNIL